MDRLDRFLAHGFQIAGHRVRNAERLGDITVLFAGIVFVVFHDRGEQNAVGHAMGDAKPSAERMRHAMHQAQADVGIRHAGDIAGVRHLLTRRDIAVSAFRQILRNHADGLHGQTIGQRPCARCDEAFNRVGQCVQAGGDLQPARHGIGQVRVHESDDRDVMRVDRHELALVRCVGDHIVDGRFRRSAGGGRHAENRDGRVLGVRHAFQRQHVGELRVRGDDANALARVLRRAAAQADEEVRAGRGEFLHAILDAFNRRIWLDIVEDLIRQAGLVKHCGHLGDRAGFQQYRIGDNESFLEAARLGGYRYLADCATAKICGLIEDHTVHHACSPSNSSHRVGTPLSKLIVVNPAADTTPRGGLIRCAES